MDRKLLAEIAAVGLLILFLGIGAYYNFVHLPEQRKAPYKQAGLTDEQASNFISKHSQQNGNSTWVDFAKEWVKNLALADTAFSAYGNLKDAINLLSINPTLIQTIYNKFLQDPQITLDKNSSTFDAMTLDAIRLYQSLNLLNKNLNSPTINTVDNITIANKQFGLPELDKNILWYLTNSTQKSEGADLVNFSPTVVKSVNSSDVYIIPKAARETWTVAKLLSMINESGFDIKNHPEMFLGLNGKIITNNWCIFDDPYGISYYDKGLTASDKRVLDLIKLQWDLYSQFSTQHNGSNLLYNRDFPWYNSTQLRASYTDANGQVDMNAVKNALFNLFYIPGQTYSTTEKAEGGFMKSLYGIEGVKTSLLQTFDAYNKNIVGLYPNGKVQTTFLGERSPRFFYYDELDDRWHHGLNNTVSQLVGGWDDTKVNHGENITYDWIESQNGLDQFLTKNWAYWDLVKFIEGYTRYKFGELSNIDGNILRMAGFPANYLIINPTPLGASQREFSVNLPPYVARTMQKQFQGSNILLGSGYDFGLFSCGDGLVKERGIDDTLLGKPIDNGILEVFKRIGNNRAYLMKRD